MPVLETKGAASAQGFGLTLVGAAPVYIEDVFSTWLYTGNNTTNTIVNGIDLAGKGGLVWVKSRSTAKGHFLYDTVRGAQRMLLTNSTAAQVNDGSGGATSGLYAFNSNGFTLGTDFFGEPNESGANLASWTFREQPKFFDVVTYTGTGSARTVAHNLGSAPGCIIIKQTNTTRDWPVYHRSLGVGTNSEILLNFTSAASGNGTAAWNNTVPTDTVFSLGSGSSVNQSGGTYVAYLFAHDAGGFGLSGTDNVISCGSFTMSTANVTVDLGYEPQFLLLKSTAAGNWIMLDVTRGFNDSGTYNELRANTTNNEVVLNAGARPNARGFIASTVQLNSGETYIYIAIRRGPMKVPTDPTGVFVSDTYAANGGFAYTGTQSYPGVNPDLTIGTSNLASTRANRFEVIDRLRGYGNSTTLGSGLVTNTTASEAANTIIFQNASGGTSSGSSISAQTKLYYSFKRAPGFFDEVCYTGTGVAGTVAHNLTVAPELMIIKSRISTTQNWRVYSASLGNDRLGSLNTNSTFSATGVWNNTTPTSSVFSLSSSSEINASGETYVAYLFASCPNVSKVGSYAGTGATQTISCGFAARFVLIKRSNIGNGNWVVFDTARGMVAGTDPRLALNSTAAETNQNWVYTNASGFEIVSGSTDINASGSTYIFLAIA